MIKKHIDAEQAEADKLRDEIQQFIRDHATLGLLAKDVEEYQEALEVAQGKLDAAFKADPEAQIYQFRADSKDNAIKRLESLASAKAAQVK